MKRLIQVHIPADLIRPNAWNPQVETDQEFALLVESIKESGGLIEPVLVRPVKGKFAWKDVELKVDEQTGAQYPVYAGQAQFEIIHGEHRFRAALEIGQLEIPCVVIEADDEFAKFLTVRLNQLHGSLDPKRLWALIQSLGKQYRMEYLARRMGFVRQEAFERLVKKAADALPEEKRGKLLKAAQEVESIEALSDVIHRLFNEGGSTLKHSFMVFEYGGKAHLMVRMNDDLARVMFAMADWCAENGDDMAEVLYGFVAPFEEEVQKSGHKSGRRRAKSGKKVAEK